MTDSRLGLAPVVCPGCVTRFLIAVSDLRSKDAAHCPKCAHAIAVAKLEEADPALARVLRVLRERDRRQRI